MQIGSCHFSDGFSLHLKKKGKVTLHTMISKVLHDLAPVCLTVLWRLLPGFLPPGPDNSADNPLRSVLLRSLCMYCSLHLELSQPALCMHSRLTVILQVSTGRSPSEKTSSERLVWNVLSIIFYLKCYFLPNIFCNLSFNMSAYVLINCLYPHKK